MKVKAKYPIKIGDVLVPAGTIGETVEPTPRILQTFPYLKSKPDGQMHLVKFPGVDECLVLKKQVTGLPDPYCKVCNGSGRYDDGDRWVPCPCVPE